jgi:hypothetical protein
MATLEITFERSSSTFNVTVDGLPNGVTDLQATEVAEALKVTDVVEQNLGGSGVNVDDVIVVSRRTV